MEFAPVLGFFYTLAVGLTGLAAYYDLRDRNLPWFLLVAGFGLALFRVILTIRTELPVGAALMFLCFVLASLVSRVEHPTIGEHDIAWYGIVAGLLGTVVPIAFFLGLSVLFALCCMGYRPWREGMPFVVPMLFAVVMVVALVSL